MLVFQAIVKSEAAKPELEIVLLITEAKKDVVSAQCNNHDLHDHMRHSLSDMVSTRKPATLDSFFELQGYDGLLSLCSSSTAVDLARTRV